MNWPPISRLIKTIHLSTRRCLSLSTSRIDVDRPTPVALPRFCNQQDWSRLRYKPQIGCYEVWNLATKHLDGCAHSDAVLCKLKLVLCFWLYKEYETCFHRKFIEVYVACAKNYQSRAWFDKVIAKIKWCSFKLNEAGVFDVDLWL